MKPYKPIVRTIYYIHFCLLFICHYFLHLERHSILCQLQLESFFKKFVNKVIENDYLDFEFDLFIKLFEYKFVVHQKLNIAIFSSNKQDFRVKETRFFFDSNIRHRFTSMYNNSISKICNGKHKIKNLYGKGPYIYPYNNGRGDATLISMPSILCSLSSTNIM